MPDVKIPQNVFIDLYVLLNGLDEDLLNDLDRDRLNRIKEALNVKLNAMVKRQKYSQRFDTDTPV